MQKNSENHLSGGLSPEKFQNFQKIAKGTFGVFYTCSYFNSPNFYTIKRVELLSENPKQKEDIQKEIVLLEKIQQNNIKPNNIPYYYGYFMEEGKSHQYYFNLVFDYLSTSLKEYITTHQKNQSFMPFPQLHAFFTQLLHGMTHLQVFEMSHKYLKPSNLFLDDSGCLKFMDIGSAKEIEAIKKKLRKDYALVNTIGTRKSQFSISSEGSKAYIPPEICDLIIVKTDMQKEINTYKGDVFAFGVIMLELGTLKKICWKGDLQKLGKEIRSNLNEMKSNYCGFLKGDEIEEFEEIFELIKDALKIEAEQRPDFLNLFSQKLVICKNKEKILNHIQLEEMNEIETKKMFRDRKKSEKSNNEDESFDEDYKLLYQKSEKENDLLIDENELLQKKIQFLSAKLMSKEISFSIEDSPEKKEEFKIDETTKLDESKNKRSLNKFILLLNGFFFCKKGKKN